MHRNHADDPSESLLELVQSHRFVAINLGLIPFDRRYTSDFRGDLNDREVAVRGPRNTEVLFMQFRNRTLQQGRGVRTDGDVREARNDRWPRTGEPDPPSLRTTL